uniref:NADH-ubiquinone oxidoreductase chain 6 n=1 Tax=Galeruca daurica TaxID=1651263 RepID=A0A0F7CS04_9CUCU|nr:NADH dehydrogenase subunit 6 [Galeruca daurica]AKG49886.1 NADH dehydrogenase subunit 6 [Galeruca daurica]
MSDMLTFIVLMITISIMFIFMNHPLTCGLMLLMQTIIISLMSSLLSLNYWYSYILFLIMIGGMLILFIYMTSIASNEKFKFNFNMMILLMMSLIMMVLSLFLDQFYINLMNQIIDMKYLDFNQNLYFSMMKYFNFPNYLIMIMMIIYLFITLIATVKITNFLYGPLRQMF